MYYIGVDYHKRFSYIVVKDEDGKPEQRGTVARGLQLHQPASFQHH
ncbi:MAG: hypothetical protein H8E40_02720 [Chloroflexi bacterium]|nr:hypothetical protein [Chloroflexota bacterium]